MMDWYGSSTKGKKIAQRAIMALLGASAIALAGCSTLQTASTSKPAQQTIGSVCATLGAAGESLKVANARAAAQKFVPIAKQFAPACESASPTQALTSAQATLYSEAMAIAAPYLGAGK